MSQSHIKRLGSAEQFISLLEHPTLLGTTLPSEYAGFIQSYVDAQLAGGNQLEDFIGQVFARIPDAVFDRPLIPETTMKLGDVVDLARYAVEQRWKHLPRAG